MRNLERERAFEKLQREHEGKVSCLQRVQYMSINAFAYDIYFFVVARRQLTYYERGGRGDGGGFNDSAAGGGAAAASSGGVMHLRSMVEQYQRDNKGNG